jgi:hypothetical protein
VIEDPVDSLRRAAAAVSDPATGESTLVALKQGDVLGDRFVIEHLAGRGGMGAVYRALDRTTGLPVGIKVMAMAKPELFVPFHYPARQAPLVTSIRSTLIVSAIQTLRVRGLYERYVAEVPPDRREPILSLIAGAWVPIELGFTHYEAMQRLGLDRTTITAIGGEVGERVNKSMMSVVVKLSKEVGVTPWTGLGYAHRARELMWKGGDVAVWKLGPKEARFDWIGQPFARVPYFVTSFGGFLCSLASLFCTKAYTRPVPEYCTPTSIGYRVSWV